MGLWDFFLFPVTSYLLYIYFFFFILHVIFCKKRDIAGISVTLVEVVLCFLCFCGQNVQVEVEALVIQGPKLATVISQVKKLEVSVLIVGQKRPSPFINW